MTASSSRTVARQTVGGAGAQRGLLLLLLVVVGALVVLFLLLQPRATSQEPYSVRSGAPGGLLGLRLWLEDLGYRVVAGRAPEAPAPEDVVFLFPDADLTSEQVQALAEQVEAGTTLVFAGAESPELTRTFGALVQRRQPIEKAVLTATQPILAAEPGLAQKVVSGFSLGSMPAAHLTPVLVAADGQVAVLLERRGQGAVWQVGIRPTFTNQELVDGWGRTLALAALRGKAAGSTVHIINGETISADGRPATSRSGQVDGLGQWLVRHPLGWAALLLAGLLLVYLFTQGRRLGPAVVGLDPHRRRAAVEHIEAMANLAQAAGHRDAIARYQKARLKRRLGQTWRVSAELDDAAFVATLTEAAQLSPANAEALTALLGRFDRARDEGDLVQTVDAASRFTLE
jgi:hypothetical protein